MADMIAVDRAALDDLHQKIDRLENMLTRLTVKQWLTVAEYAAQEGVSESTVRRWRRQGVVETQNGRVLNPQWRP